MTDKKGILSMHDKKPLNKTNYIPHHNGSMPKEIENSSGQERREKSQRLRKDSVPHIKNANVVFLKTPPRVFYSVVVIVHMAISDHKMVFWMRK